MPSPKLYLLTNDDPLSVLLPKLDCALGSGAVDVLQIRRKDTLAKQDLNRYYAEVETILSHCMNYDIDVVVNDNLELATHFGVGVHLGQADGSVREARQVLGKNALIGSTCHASLPLVLSAKEAGASYAAMGTMFVSSTKPSAKIVPNEILKQADKLGIDLCVIGGITLDNAPVLQKMLDGTRIQYIAVTADIINKREHLIAKHCRDWRRLLDNWY
ncbi:MAG: thiamine phosphate synthase [Moraxella sp.]|nr:thiamine phosphate synthase [Moraxella sp.]